MLLDILGWLQSVVQWYPSLGAADPLGSGSKGKEFEQLIAGALDFANDLQFEGGGRPEAKAKGWKGQSKTTANLLQVEARKPLRLKIDFSKQTSRWCILTKYPDRLEMVGDSLSHESSQVAWRSKAERLVWCCAEVLWRYILFAAEEMHITLPCIGLWRDDFNWCYNLGPTQATIQNTSPRCWGSGFGVSAGRDARSMWSFSVSRLFWHVVSGMQLQWHLLFDIAFCCKL